MDAYYSAQSATAGSLSDTHKKAITCKIYMQRYVARLCCFMRAVTGTYDETGADTLLS